MRQQILTTFTVAALTAASVIACGGGAPTPDSAGAAPSVADSATVPAVVAPVTSSHPDTADVAWSPQSRPGAKAEGRAARSGHAASGSGAPPDTVRGVVSEVGSYPMTSVVVQPASGGVVTITGALAREIGRAGGAEVWVSGTRDARSLEAGAYAIRTVDGNAAIDGVLARDGDRIVLVTPDGRRPIARPLQALRGMIGARVWLVGPLDGTISSYGVLREP